VTALAATTLGLCLLGFARALWLVSRRGVPAGALALLFACGALRQGALLYTGSPTQPGLALSADTLAELALLGTALAGLAVLRRLRRITRERDRAEDLHWDSMESVRAMSELAARPAADLGDKLRTVLELGATRFGLELGIAWCEGRSDEGELLGLHTPASDRPQEETLGELLPALRDLVGAPRARVVVRPETRTPTLFGVGVAVDGGPRGVLAFAGRRGEEGRFTATDKDLLGLMGQWLATELERRTRAKAAARPDEARPAQDEVRHAPAEPRSAPGDVRHAPAEPRSAPARATLSPLRPRRGRDLNAAVRRAERGLRRRVGVEATLELSLDPKLPRARPGRLSLPTLVESVVLAAARLAPTGRLHVETRHDGGAGDLMLQVSVKDEAIDADGFERIFTEDGVADLPQGALPLARLERLLRRDDGDLSVAVEPGHGAVLCAYLPAQTARSDAADAQPARRSSQPSR
jgi:hypothetical protein